MDQLNLLAIMVAGFVASASPGPATMAIAGTSMAQGRRAGLAVASGITTGSWMWSIAAALGLGAVMQAHGWMLESARYVGAGYLMWLAYKSARSALSQKTLNAKAMQGGPRKLYIRGMALHLTNPKSVLFFGALYSIGVPQGATTLQLATVVCAIGLQSLIVFHTFALIFSASTMIRAYVGARRWFEGVFALGFGLAGIKVLTARLS